MRASQPNCYLCGLPISLELDRQRHPLASSVDHLVPLSRTSVTYNVSDLAHMHRLCNGMKFTKPITPELRAKCRAAVEARMGRVVVRRW